MFTIEDWFGVTDSAFDVRQSFKAVEWLEIISETSEPHRRQERPLTQSMKGKKFSVWLLKSETYLKLPITLRLDTSVTSFKENKGKITEKISSDKSEESPTGFSA